MEELNEQKAFDIKKFVEVALKRWYIVVLVLAVCLTVAHVYKLFFITPTYRSSAKLYIMSKMDESGTAELTVNDITISTHITADFAEIIKDKYVLQDVSEHIGGKYSASQIQGALTVNYEKNSRLIALSVTTTNPEDSKLIIDGICDVTKEKMVELMGLAKVNILHYGNLPRNPVSSQSVYTTATALALMISGIILLLLYATNNKILSSEDVEYKLKLNVLSTIPYDDYKKANSPYNRYKYMGKYYRGSRS